MNTMGVPTCDRCGKPVPADGRCNCGGKSGRAVELSRRGFFGATSAALVAMLAPKRAYSFLWENPLSHKWRTPVVIGPHGFVRDVLVVTSAEQAAELLGGSVLRWQPFFDYVHRPVTLHVGNDRAELRATRKAEADRVLVDVGFGGKDRA